MKQVLKWTVRSDDQYHEIGAGPVVMTMCENGPTSVQVWTEEEVGTEVYSGRMARVFSDGQPLADQLQHIGSATWGTMVWHVYVQTKEPEQS
jgi:hypothetical protein